MSSRNFFAELKRRNVCKVAVAYAVVAWLIIQITTQVEPAKFFAGLKRRHAYKVALLTRLRPGC